MSATNDCTPRTVKGRLKKAKQFLLAAETIDLVLDDEDDPDVSDAFVTLCVHAGIAAADVICCRSLGKHAQGDNHHEAVTLLGQVDNDAANDLERLLRKKTKAGYSARPVSEKDRKQAERAASRLVGKAQKA